MSNPESSSAEPQISNDPEQTASSNKMSKSHTAGGMQLRQDSVQDSDRHDPGRGHKHEPDIATDRAYPQGSSCYLNC